MIPLGVLGGARHVAASGGASVVQTGVHKGLLSEQLSISLSPLTPGNLLVVAVRDIASNPAYTFSHPLIKHYDDNRGGWNLSLWSCVIPPGAASTVVLDQANSPSQDSMGAWELSGVSAFASRTTVQANYAKTLSPPAHTEPGLLGLVTLMLGSASTDTGGLEVVNGVIDGTGKGLAFGHVPDPQTPVTLSWTSGSNEAVASVARFV